MTAGSSPRVWGTYKELRADVQPARFIPTCVGNIADTEETRTAASVHPHVCGEHPARQHGGRACRGSSPRVWGTSRRGSLFSRRGRFIPTCVGNILRFRFMSAQIAVHPHVCGEHSSGNVHRMISIGSSPRVWGTLADPTADVTYRRFIPTCVGNIQGRLSDSDNPAVHPHVCGEHMTISARTNRTTGSSPRVWGTSCASARRACMSRFIPTCVGNIRTAWRRRPFPSVHPHVCGEHTRGESIVYPRTGSSPRVWGTCHAVF